MTPELVAIVTVGGALVGLKLMMLRIMLNRFDRIDAWFDRIDARFERLEERMAALEQRVARLEGVLDGLRESLFSRASG